MKPVIIILTLVLLTACTTSTSKQSQVSLENKQWEPVNKNYMNKKDF